MVGGKVELQCGNYRVMVCVGCRSYVCALLSGLMSLPCAYHTPRGIPVSDT
ncbi:hypothetical protein BaRGS_00025455, partial [Batillaria attramentaria]